MSEPTSAVALASQSPRRLQLLRALGLAVTVVETRYDEYSAVPPGRAEAAAGTAVDARGLALWHAEGKARGAHSQGPPLLIAADTVVDLDGAVLGKPRDAAEAGDMLRRLAGREHRVHTGFVAVDRRADKRISGVESTQVTFLPLADELIERYVASGEPLDKAGAYGVQKRGALLIESIKGDFYTVMGLPLARVGRACAALGYALL